METRDEDVEGSRSDGELPIARWILGWVRAC